MGPKPDLIRGPTNLTLRASIGRSNLTLRVSIRKKTKNCIKSKKSKNKKRRRKFLLVPLSTFHYLKMSLVRALYTIIDIKISDGGGGGGPIESLKGSTQNFLFCFLFFVLLI